MSSTLLRRLRQFLNLVRLIESREVISNFYFSNTTRIFTKILVYVGIQLLMQFMN